MRVLAARGLELERELAFGGVRQLLEPVVVTAAPGEARRLFAGAASPAARLFEHVRADLRPEADPEFAVLNGVYWLLAALADVQPLALVIDDAHWLDPPSLRVLDFLAPRIEELAAVAIIGTRPLSEHDADAAIGRLLADPATRVVRPGPLSPPAVRELVLSRIREQPDPVFVEACAEVTGGNPFYLGELLRELELSGVHGSSHEAAQVREVGPRNISLSLRHRGAGTANRAALARALSVLGESDDFAQLAALAGLDPADAGRTADALVRDAILVPGPPLAFAHPIVRTAMYSEMGPRERASLHGRAVALLRRSNAAVDRVAAHVMRSDPAGDAGVIADLRAAARDALAQGAPETAASYLRRALEEPPDEPARAELLLDLARAEKTSLDPRALEHFAEAYALAPDARMRGRVTLDAAPVLSVAGRYDEAAAMGSPILEQLHREDPHLALELETELLSLALYNLGVSASDAEQLFDSNAERLPADSPLTRRVLCHAAFLRTWRSDDAGLAAELAERGLAGGLLLSERGTEAQELTSAGLTLIYADRLDSASALVDAALADARTHGARFGFALISAMAAELSYREGSLADAEAHARASLAITGPSGHRAGIFVGTAILIRTLIDRGSLSEAVEAMHDHGLADLAAAELPPMLGFDWLLSDRGRLRVACGDQSGGLRDLRECGRRSREFGVRNPLVTPWRPALALAYQAGGEDDAARSLAEEDLAAARDWGTPGTIGAAMRLLGLLSAGTERIALLREAVALLERSPARLEHARAVIDLGAALRRANRRAEAREPLSRGLDIADRCGATTLSRRARDELAAAGARPRRTRLTGLEALTASERRVAEMAARGLSNTEIAQTLFVTRKTVEKHLGNAYTKLDVKSRGQLPAQLAEQSQARRDEQRRLRDTPGTSAQLPSAG